MPTPKRKAAIPMWTVYLGLSLGAIAWVLYNFVFHLD